MKRQRLGISLVVALGALSSTLALAPLGAAATTTFCSAGSSYSGTTITWTGGGDGHSWDDAENWSPATVPDADQTPATFQTQYVCIGEGSDSKPAAVSISGGEAFHVAGVDVGQGATLTVKPGGELDLGAVSGTAVTPSLVEKGSVLQAEAATMSGNGPLTVAGTLRWTGDIVKAHRDIVTQDGGATTIAAGGRLLIDGVKFGGVNVTGGRVIHNSGTITFSGFGYLAMDNGTKLIDEPHSTLNFDGVGGIYLGSTAGSTKSPTIRQDGSLVRDQAGTSVAVVGVPISFGSHKPKVSIKNGPLVLDLTKAPTATVRPSSGYGVGSCVLVKIAICRRPAATAAEPQVAYLGTSTEAPKVSNITVALAAAPAKLHGHTVLGQATDVTAPTAKTSHSSHLTFSYDVTTHGLTSTTKPTVYRNSHAVTICAVHGLTAINTSCIISESVAHSGGSATKGDLTIVLITIQPDGHWITTT